MRVSKCRDKSLSLFDHGFKHCALSQTAKFDHTTTQLVVARQDPGQRQSIPAENQPQQRQRLTQQEPSTQSEVVAGTAARHVEAPAAPTWWERRWTPSYQRQHLATLMWQRQWQQRSRRRLQRSPVLALVRPRLSPHAWVKQLSALAARSPDLRLCWAWWTGHGTSERPCPAAEPSSFHRHGRGHP